MKKENDKIGRNTFCGVVKRAGFGNRNKTIYINPV
jgi:hypothetical protein